MRLEISYLALFFFFAFCTPDTSDPIKPQNDLEVQSSLNTQVNGGLKDLKTKDLKVSQIKKNSNLYLQISFSRALDADYVQYTLCIEDNKECSSSRTIEEQAVFWKSFKGFYIASVKSCKSLSEGDICGEELKYEGTFDASANSIEVDSLVQMKDLLNEKIESSGAALYELIDIYLSEFPACLEKDSTFVPMINDEDARKLKEIDAHDLGEAIRALMAKLIEPVDEESDTKIDKDENDPTTGLINMIFGITGLAVSVGVLVEVFSEQTKKNRIELEKMRNKTSLDFENKAIKPLDFKKSKFSVRAGKADFKSKSFDSRARFSDMSIKNKFKVIGIGAVGAALFGVMVGLAAAELSPKEDEGLSLAGDKDSCEANNNFHLGLEKIASRLADLAQRADDIELELELLEEI